MRKLLATLAVVGVLAFGAPNAVEAQRQDGLVNVMVGDVTILQDVSVAVAADVVAQICGVSANVQAAILARAILVDRTGRPTTICRTQDGRVTIVQN